MYLVRTQILWKTNISYLRMRTRMCVYQVIRNGSFSEHFAHVLNDWFFLWHLLEEHLDITFCQIWAGSRHLAGWTMGEKL